MLGPLLMAILMTSAMSALFMSHPISITITIIAQTIMVSLIITLSYQTPWFSYILLLVFLGGMLILFSYITSLTTNFTFKPNTLWYLLPPLMVFSLLASLIYRTELYPQSPQFMLNKLFYQKAATTTIMALFLLAILLVAVNITAAHSGPLQKKT